jgi:actin-like ATPase involved in cell morphogenesis
VLDYRVFADHFCVEHLCEALSHLVPTRHCRNVVEHGRRLVEGTALLHIFDELNAAKVHVVVAVLHRPFVVDTVRHVLR